MNKKIISIALSLTLLFLLINNSSATIHAEQSMDDAQTMQGRIYNNLDESGSQLNSENFSDTDINFTKINISNNVNISGSVGKESAKIPFNIEGELTKAEYPGK